MTDLNSSIVLSFTEAAHSRISAVMQDESVPPGYCLRVGIRGGGCGSLDYLLGFDQPGATDSRHEIQGLPVIIAAQHGMHVMGMEIDYIENDDVKGFVFNNPVKKRSSEEAPS